MERTPCWPSAASRLGAVLFLAMLSLLSPGCANGPVATPQPGAASAPADAQDQLGIRVHGLHLSAHDHVLDLRYRVVDPVKAAPLLNAKSKLVLLDVARNARLGVPQSPVIGGMRQTSRNHVVYTDRDYFILFMNPGRAVQPGDKLQLLVDGRSVAELAVGGREVQ